MPADDQQLRAIAFLAPACRPHGARHWDADGVYANLAKVCDRSLGSIIIATIQAAEDRDALTPGVIPKAGPHWRTPEAAPVTASDKTEPSAHCAGCGQSKAACEARLAAQRGLDPDDPRYDDHAYVSVAAAKQRPAGSAVDELRDIKANATTNRAEEAS